MIQPTVFGSVSVDSHSVTASFYSFLAVAITIRQGLKEVLSSCPGQVHFPAMQVTFICACLMGQGLDKLSACLAQGEQNLRVACLKAKLEF